MNKKKIIIVVSIAIVTTITAVLILLCKPSKCVFSFKEDKSELIKDSKAKVSDNVDEDKKEILKRINYLQRVLCKSSDYSEFSNIMMNDEWLLFSYSFTSFALTNIATKDSSFTSLNSKIINSLIKSVLHSDFSYRYGIDSSKMYSDNIPEYSVLYLGHLNLMLGCYRLLSEDSTYNQLNDYISRSLFTRYNSSKSMNLESYPNSIWISDNTVALASLEMHSTVTGSNYNSICDEWVLFMKEKYTDNSTGVLYSTINAQTGEPAEIPRGSMLGWDIIFISKFDKEYAIELYDNYLTHFSDNYVTFRLFKERSGVSETSYGDIDSGPLLAGYSIPANVFVLACANVAGDYKTASQIESLLNLGTQKIDKNNEIHYEVSLLDMEISPMAEAIVLYAMTVEDWK